MGVPEDLYEPETEDEARDAAVKMILRAASYLCLAADFVEEEEPVDHYVNGAIHLRDLANSLSPEKPAWPSEGAAIYDLKTKQRVN